MISFLNTYLFAIIEPAIIFLALNKILPNRNNKVTQYVLFAVNVIVYFITLFFVSSLSIFLKSIILLFMCTTITWFSFKVKTEVRLFFIMISFELSLIADSILGNACSFIIGDNIYEILQSNIAVSFILALSSKLLFGLFEFVFVLFSQKFVFNNERRQWVVIDFIMAIIYGIIVWFLGVSPILQQAISPIQASVVSTAFIFVFLLVVYFFREVSIFQQKESENYNTLMTNKILENEIKSLQLNTEHIRKIKHDMQNHILCIEQLSKKANDFDVVNYCKDFFDVESSFENRYINHEVINAILNYKIAEMNRFGMKFKLEIDDLYDIKIKASDITGILSNLLDNSIEASKKLFSQDTDIIIKIGYYKGYLLFYIKNKCDVNQLKSINTSFITSKSDNINHGFGLKIISDITKKYSGICNQYTEKEYFVSLVMLMNKPNAVQI